MKEQVLGFAPFLTFSSEFGFPSNHPNPHWGLYKLNLLLSTPQRSTLQGNSPGLEPLNSALKGGDKETPHKRVESLSIQFLEKLPVSCYILPIFNRPCHLHPILIMKSARRNAEGTPRSGVDRPLPSP
jgi:hypothetical protein